MPEPLPFQLETVFRVDAAELAAARTKGLMLHRSDNIRASGDEIEVAVRRMLARRLPTGFYVGHGHIVDQMWKRSQQLDVIIADNFACPILFQAENGTEFFPYESVYAFGEVKTTYEKEHIDSFIETISQTRKNLFRSPTPPNFLTPGRGRGIQMLGESLDPRIYKNPLFTFMIFFESDGMKPQHLFSAYKGKAAEELPNVICFLDRGILAYGLFDRNKRFVGFHEMPEFHAIYEEPGCFSKWAWLCASEQDQISSTALAIFYFVLFRHVQNCVLMPPDLMTYGMKVIDQGKPWWKSLENEQKLQKPLF